MQAHAHVKYLASLGSEPCITDAKAGTLSRESHLAPRRACNAAYDYFLWRLDTSVHLKLFGTGMRQL
jgi:hypothetical protein